MKPAWHLILLVSLALGAWPCAAEDKLTHVDAAIRAADEALKPVDPLVLNIRYVSGVGLSKVLERSRKEVTTATKLLVIRREHGLNLADEFLLFNVMTSLRENMESLSESLRNVDGAFGEIRPNNLAGKWNEPVHESVGLVSHAALSIEEDLYKRLDDADKRLEGAKR